MRRNDEKGAVMVEFAIIVPVLLMLVIGIIQFGQAYNIQISIQAAAREGARARALQQSVADAVAGAAPNAAVSAESGCLGGADGTATVTVTQDYRFSIPFVDLATKTLTATGTMRCGA